MACIPLITFPAIEYQIIITTNISDHATQCYFNFTLQIDNALSLIEHGIKNNVKVILVNDINVTIAL